MARFFCLTLALSALSLATLPVHAEPGNPSELPRIKDFLGEAGFGSLHEEAPPQTEQFGTLVGLWKAQPEMRQSNGKFAPDAPGFWVWRYALDGFAIQDLWYQSADNLPSYLKHLGRDYLLTSIRVFDPNAKHWNVAWMANGAGKAGGLDSGTFAAEMKDDEIVMTSPPIAGMGHQRVTFSEITADSFLWQSDYSTDGETWMTVMRIRATRVAGS